MSITWVEKRPNGDVDLTIHGTAQSSDGTILYVCCAGRIWKSANSGTSWTEPRPVGDAGKQWRSIICSDDGQKVWAGIQSGRLYYSANGGTDWVEKQPAGNVNGYWYCMAMSDDGSVVIQANAYGRLYISTDSGDNWTERKPAGDINVDWSQHGAACSEDGAIIYIAEGSYGRMYKSTNSGANWTTPYAPGARPVNVGCSTDGSIVWFGIYNGRVYKSTNGMTNVTDMLAAGANNKAWKAGTCSDDGSIAMYAYSPTGRCYSTIDGGTNWVEEAPTGTLADYTFNDSISMNSDGSAILIAANSRLWRGTQTVGTPGSSSPSSSPSASISPSSSYSPSISPSLSPSSSISPSSSESSSKSSSASRSPSASYSPSSSVSLSPSSSPSKSPSSSQSSSYSPSVSPSASPSVSPSLSPSSSPSSSQSASYSQSSSPSSSVSLSPSSSQSSSPSSSPSLPADKNYTKGQYSDLPADNTDLETAYTQTDIDNVATKDDVRVDQEGSDKYAIHLYKDLATANSVNLEWEGQSTFAPSIIPVYLQIYNITTTTWETLDSDNTTAADTDFILTADVSDLTNYKDGSDFIACRIYQDLR